MEKTWRWFGKKDKITLQMLRQIGVEGIVTALHDIKNGKFIVLKVILLQEGQTLSRCDYHLTAGRFQLPRQNF